MRLLADFILFALGLAAALMGAALARQDGSVWNMVQVPLIVMVLAVFYLQEKQLAALAVGVGLGLDIVSAYPFLTWLLIIGGLALAGWWIAKNILTNRSLPSLILLGLAMRVIYLFLELGFSRLGEVFDGTVWYKLTGVSAGRLFEASGIELLILVVCFIIHLRLRGERSRMLSHV